MEPPNYTPVGLDMTGLSQDKGSNGFYPEWLTPPNPLGFDPLLYLKSGEGPHLGRVVMPFIHSPNMISNGRRGTNWQNRNPMRRSQGSTDSGFSSPDPMLGYAGMISNEDSSDDADSLHHVRTGRPRTAGYPQTRNQGSHFYYRQHQSMDNGHSNHNSYNKKRQQYTQRPLVATVERQARTSRDHGTPQLGRRPSLPNSTYLHYNPADKFLARAHLVQVTCVPSQLKADGEWGKLSQQIYNKFMANQQTKNTFEQKMTLWEHLFLYIRRSLPQYGLFLVGSTMNGFGSNESDVDMCLMVRHMSQGDSRNLAIYHLAIVSRHLKQCDFVHHVSLIHAKVPILRFQGLGFSVDLNCNNAVGIRNTHLLHSYAQLDWRVRPLVVIVKLWASSHDINDAKNKTISSYSLSLMVIHFLQSGVSPAVLPCLQDMYKEKFDPQRDVNLIEIDEQVPPHPSSNTQSLGQLLLGFLEYYACFDYSKYAISVRLAAKMDIENCRHAKTFKNDPLEWKCLCIEEPFELTNTARSVYDAEKFKRIQHVLQTSYHRLNETHCLESIFK